MAIKLEDWEMGSLALGEIFTMSRIDAMSQNLLYSSVVLESLIGRCLVVMSSIQCNLPPFNVKKAKMEAITFQVACRLLLRSYNVPVLKSHKKKLTEYNHSI